jgi:2-polyprenyl-6-methoxyphenol hydroxylase-like FAD-dependent oxidoreductase
VRELSVGILGCGTAGSAAALLLERAGHRVTVYERVADPRPVGAGITLQPTGIHVLRRLGLKSDVSARGARIDRLRVVDARGKSLFDLRYRDVGERLYGLGVHRGVVFQSLFDEVRARAIDVRLGVAGEDLARAEAPATSVPGGPARPPPRRHWIVDDEGKRHGPHELILVCDGARSHFRDDTDLSKRINVYPWGALWFVGEDPKRAYGHTLHQAVRGTRQMLGLLPTGTGPEGMTPLVSLFWSLRADRLSEWRAAGLEAWRRDALALCPQAEPVLLQIREPEQVLYSGYLDVRMERWNTRSVVYLGDAAHAMSPQLGQGCNLALWDALVLAETLAAHEDLPVALDAYSRERRPHLAFYQLATRWLTPLFQGDRPALGHLRDTFMPLLARVGITRKLMTLAMCGVLEGFAGGTVAEPGRTVKLLA